MKIKKLLDDEILGNNIVAIMQKFVDATEIKIKGLTLSNRGSGRGWLSRGGWSGPPPFKVNKGIL